MFRRLFVRGAGALLIVLPISASASAAIDWNDPDSVLEAAIAASPSLREIAANLAAARAAQRGAGATPNPMLMAGGQNHQNELPRDPRMTKYMAGAPQTFLAKQHPETLYRAPP